MKKENKIKKLGVAIEEHLLTPKQLSEFLQIEVSTVYKWTHYGYVPHFKIGGNIRFDLAQIKRWLNRRQKRGRDTYKLEVSLEE